MSFTKITQELLNETLTEKGDKAFKSTLSPCLDYFSLIGGKRFHLWDTGPLFVKAFADDPITALKLLFYTRDIRGGLGERRIFRFLMNSLAVSYPEIAVKLVSYIPQYGRYDDLLCLLETPIEDEVINLISSTLESDLENKKNGKSISLLAKWLPSINTSSEEARRLARYLCSKMNISYKDYRKTLSYLRNGLIIENNLREDDYTFDYAQVPSVAMNKYIKVFYRKDEERIKEYISSVRSDKNKMHTDVLDVVTLIKRAKESFYEHDIPEDYYNATWKSLVDKGEINRRTLVVRDGSGSMTGIYEGNIAPLDVADAMALLTASRLNGEFHNKFMTFSSEPEFVDLTGAEGVFAKLNILKKYDDCSTTNIEAVYNLIIDIYRNPNFKKEDALEQILIISDMQFDCLKYSNFRSSERKSLQSTFEYFKEEFSKLEYKMPEIIFWNVDARNDSVPVTQNEMGVKLISGSSQNIIDLVINNASINPLEFMNDVLKAYSFIDKLFMEKE